MPRGAKWHIEHNVGDLSCLADGPVKECKRLRWLYGSRIDDNVLYTNIEIDRATQVRVLAINNMIIWKIAARLQDGRIDRISHNHRTNEELDTSLHQVRPGR